MYKVELLNSSTITELGEAPHWDADTQSLYFLDVLGSGRGAQIFRYDYAEQRQYSATIDNEPIVGSIIPVAGTRGEFAVSLGRRLAIVRWDGIGAKAHVLRIVFAVESEHRLNRLNDAKADPAGRWFGGTMLQTEEGDAIEGSDNGALYRFAAGDAEPTRLKSGICVSNGLAWNVLAKKMYYVDSGALDVKEFDYDAETGEVSNERVLLDFRKPNGDWDGYYGDGMTIDTDGFLYVAGFAGSRVLRIDPFRREIVQTIELPVEQITSCAFGGPNLDVLFVTTAAMRRTTVQPPPAGRLFAVRGLGVRGMPMDKVRL